MDIDIWEVDRLILFIAFVIPGFISIKAYQLVFPSDSKSTSDQLIDAIAYSCINYAILILPILWVENLSLEKSRSYWYGFFYIAVLFIAPVLWVLLWKFLRTREFFQRNAPHPIKKPWDYVFSQRKPYWIKITLKSGAVIGGKFSSKSFASSAPAPEQIYLEESWVIGTGGAFERPKSGTAGVMILSNEISYIELKNMQSKRKCL